MKSPTAFLDLTSLDKRSGVLLQDIVAGTRTARTIANSQTLESPVVGSGHDACVHGIHDKR